MNFLVPADSEGMRLDLYLARQMESVSRAYIARLIQEGKVTCGGKPCKPSLKLREGDAVDVVLPPPAASRAEPQDIGLDIVYEDEWIAVVNKPQGLVVHPAPGHRDGTLVNALLYRYRDGLSDLNGVLRPGIVHRIDKDTSGLLMIVKNNEVHGRIASMISRHEVRRTYLAVVCGAVRENGGTVDLPLGRNPQNRLKAAVVKDGKRAVTHFRVLQRFPRYTYLELVLETGRTHQIRAHLSHIGHPVLGDPLYGGIRKEIPLEGQALHAFRLEFTHPVTNRVIMVEAPVPDHFRHLLDTLQHGAGS